MGLLDGFLGKDWNDPQSAAVMALAGGLLGGDFGKGARDYGNVLAGAKDAEMKRKMIEMQMQEGQMRNDMLRQQVADQTQMRDLAAKFRIPATPNGLPGGLPAGTVNALPQEFQTGSTVQAAAPRGPGFDREGYASALEGINPELGLSYLQKIKKDDTPVKLAPGEQLFSGKASGYKPLMSVPAKPDAKPSALQEYEYAKGQGYAGTFDQWDRERKKAGATNVSMKVENKMGEGVAAQIGPMIKDTYTAANGAAQQVDAARRIIQAVDTGKIMAGPMADWRLKGAQLGQVLGVTGKDEAEKIANTRQAIRGLAEMTLQGRKQMSGQGAITESEGALAEKANSGRIEDLTAAEIKQLAKASARAAKFVYGQHQEMVKNLSENPNTAGLAKFYKPMPLGDVPEDAPAPAAIDSLVDKYRSR